MSLNPGASSFAPPMPPVPRARASVKHLTCYYWATGKCRHPEDQCLYSHKHTGRMANKPVKLEHDSKLQNFQIYLKIHHMTDTRE